MEKGGMLAKKFSAYVPYFQKLREQFGVNTTDKELLEKKFGTTKAGAEKIAAIQAMVQKMLVRAEERGRDPEILRMILQ